MRQRSISEVGRGLLLAAALLVMVDAHSARANLELGACCFANGTCEDLMVTQCDGANGDFIGEGTACATTNCGATSAPLLSAAGTVVAASGLIGVAAVRMLRRRRR